MTKFTQAPCNQALVILLPNRKGPTSEVRCRAPHRHEGSHIWDLVVFKEGAGRSFIRIYSDQIEEIK